MIDRIEHWQITKPVTRSGSKAGSQPPESSNPVGSWESDPPPFSAANSRCARSQAGSSGAFALELVSPPRGEAAIAFEGQMVDEPLARQARAVLAASEPGLP